MRRGNARGDAAFIAALKDEFLKDLRHMPKLRMGVAEGLREVRDRGWRLIIASEGGRGTCAKRLSHYGLCSFVDEIHDIRKSPEAFRELSLLFEAETRTRICIGDQLDRDILFAKEAGFVTVYFPGTFVPSWAPRVEDVKPDFTVKSFDGLINIADSVLKGLD